MTNAATRHRALDRAFLSALGEFPAMRSSALTTEGSAERMIRRRPRVMLHEVEIRTTGRTGRPWYSAWLGGCRLVGGEAAGSRMRAVTA